MEEAARCTSLGVASTTIMSYPPKWSRLQVTDISQYGDIAAAQSVLVPTGAKVLDKSTTKVQQPPRNTGTLAGVFQAPPTTVYR